MISIYFISRYGKRLSSQNKKSLAIFYTDFLALFSQKKEFALLKSFITNTLKFFGSK